MKSIERHKLKENEFARTVTRAREMLETSRRGLSMALAGTAIVILVIAALLWWRQARASGGNEMLATALAVYDAPVVPITAPAPGSPAPVPQAGTFSTEQEKLVAALPKFRETVDKYPNTGPGLVARFHLAGILAALGQYPEAEQQFQEVVGKGGGTIYARTARLGLADSQVAQGKYDSAIAIYTEISRDATSQIPVDGVLMHLARAYSRAGRKEEAARTFDRVLQEFPQSPYAADARRELEDARQS